MSGFVTINTAPRRKSRRQRNKPKTAPTTATCTTTISKIISENKPEPAPQKKIIKQQAVSKQAVSKQSKSTAQQSEIKQISVWAQRAQAKASQKKTQKKQQKPTQSKPVATKKFQINKQPQQKSSLRSGRGFVPTKKSQINKQSQQSQQKSSLRSGRGFSARKVAHKFDANSVNMYRNLKQEAFSSSADAAKMKANKKSISELQNNILKDVKKNRNSGGYRPKRVANAYDPNSIDMTKRISFSRKLNNNNVQWNNSNKMLSNGNCDRGLSSRAKGFRFKSTYSENIKLPRPVANSGGSIRPKPKPKQHVSG